MSSYQQKKSLIVKKLPCPECGKMDLCKTVENCVLDDGLKVQKLKHYKCHSCGARFFDDEAIHIVQLNRSSHAWAA